MILTGTLWLFSMLALLLGAVLVFRRLRRGTHDYADVRAYKARLPGWVAPIERALWYLLLALIGAGVFRMFQIVRASWRGPAPLDGPTAGFAVLGAVLVALPAAMLCANAISWLAPPLRKANLSAMASSSQSFGKANRGLVLVGAVTVPLGLVALVLAIMEPWAG